MNLAPFTGPAAFGQAYQAMLEQDAHTPSSVDRVLANRMVRLCAETQAYLYHDLTPTQVHYTPRSRPELEAMLASLRPAGPGSESLLAAIAAFTCELGARAPQALDEMSLGGTEEEIVRRGSDWCTDVARVACALCQVAGFPARIVHLFDLDQAYSGHAIVEVFRSGKWGAIDSSTGIVYSSPGGAPASVWELMNDQQLIAAHSADPRAFYTTPGQFRAAGIANYFCWESHHYDYTISGLNDYYRSILWMAEQGWPGGLRWLHGEGDPAPHIRDGIARTALALLRQGVYDGAEYTQPWLDLDVPAYCAYRNRETSVLPFPYRDDPVARVMMEGVQDQDVLCLAGGGGQQSAVFSLLGARVTVLDLSPEQLQADQRAAEHYGYQVTPLQGDMRDLSALPEAGFDRVYQLISTLFVPDLREVDAQVARVLKPGGLYAADYAVPLLYLAETQGWDGSGYVLRVTEPYARGAILETAEGRLNLTEGQSFSEFHHLWSDILNGLIEAGLAIRAVWENPRPGSSPPLDELVPGSKEHQERYLPFGVSVVAQKTRQLLHNA